MNQFKKLLLRLLRKLGILSGLNLVMHTALKGKRIRVPIFHNLGLPNLTPSDPWMIQLFEYCLSKKGGCLIDAGVNVGQTLVRFLATSHAAQSRPYYGFEPNPDCVYYSNRLMRENRFANGLILPVGLSNQDAIVELFANYAVDGAASIVPGFRDTAYSYKWKIFVRKGDLVLSELGINDVAMIKIDVEGAELEVVSGLSETLSKVRPFVCCEVLPVYSLDKEFGEFRFRRQQQLESVLRDFNYRIMRVLDKNKNRCRLQALDEFGVHDNMELSDYLFVPAEHFDTTSQTFS